MANPLETSHLPGVTIDPRDEGALEAAFGVTSNAEELVRQNHARYTAEQRKAANQPINQQLTATLYEGDPSPEEQAPENLKHDELEKAIGHPIVSAVVRGTGRAATISYVYQGPRGGLDKDVIPYAQVFGSAAGKRKAAGDEGDARERAEGVLSDAEEKAREVAEEAREEAEKLLREAREEAERLREQAEQEIAEIRGKAAEKAVDVAESGDEAAKRRAARSGSSKPRAARSASSSEGGSKGSSKGSEVDAAESGEESGGESGGEAAK